nr:IS5 family transposase [Frankia sp. Cj3]
MPPDWPVAVDSTVVRTHQHTAGARHAPASDLVAAYPDTKEVFRLDDPDGREALGRSHSGHSTTLHRAADARRRPLSRVTAPGQRHDTTACAPVMAGIRVRRPGGVGRPRTRATHILGDKAYSSHANRAYLRRRKIRAVIPERADQAHNRKARGSRGGRPPACDAELYTLRTVAERSINKRKQLRAVATKYDKRDYMYQATVDIASIKIWLRDLTESPQGPG